MNEKDEMWWEEEREKERTKKKQTPWFQSASEHYRPSDRRLSAKLVPTLADRVSCSQRNESPRPLISVF
jgi:hypothetical protein